MGERRSRFSTADSRKMPSSQEKIYFLIDEIQFVEGWQKNRQCASRKF